MDENVTALEIGLLFRSEEAKDEFKRAFKEWVTQLRAAGNGPLSKDEVQLGDPTDLGGPLSSRPVPIEHIMFVRGDLSQAPPKPQGLAVFNRYINFISPW